jgi:hypothetical protein
MNRYVTTGFAIAAFALTAPAVDAQFKGGGNVSATKYGWLSSLQAGKAQAAKTGKPMMVVIRCVP